MDMNSALYISSGDHLIRKDDREEFLVLARYRDKGDPSEKLELESIKGENITIDIDENLFNDWEKKNNSEVDS